jgi:hypothetical protein
MSTDKQRGEDLIQHILLANDHLAHLGKDAFADRMEPFDAMLQLGCVLAKFRERYHRQFPSSRLRILLLKETADLSTPLRSGRDDKFSCTNKIVISTGA